MSDLAWPEIVFLVHGKPRTVRELRELTGRDEEPIRGCIKRLVDEGLVVTRESRRTHPLGKPAKVWEWNR